MSDEYYWPDQCKTCRRAFDGSCWFEDLLIYPALCKYRRPAD